MRRPNEALLNRRALQSELSRRHFRDFITYTMPAYSWNWHHARICEALESVLAGNVRHLMVFVPPQRGKSEIVSRRFPAYALGKNPDLKIACCSYSSDLSAQFNRECQRIITTQEYRDIFPGTRLTEKNIRTDAQGAWLRNSDVFEVVGRRGSYVSTGIGGALTGKQVDVLLIDDPVKNAVEAKSPATQKRNIEWWETVAQTRLHNDSRVIVCMTRWDELDLAGYLLLLQGQQRGVKWEVISIPEIKESDDDPNDPRAIGEVLWPERHSLERALQIKASSPVTFQGMYQQNPAPAPEGQVFPDWKHCDAIPDGLIRFYCLDFGFTNDPATVIECAAHGTRGYARELFYERGMTNKRIAERLKPMLQYPDSPIYADSAEPKSIAELREYGLNVIPAAKGKDSVLAGIQFLHGYEMFIVNPSPNIDIERKYYQWLTGADGKPTNIPIDKFNHTFDAIRYGYFTHLFMPTQSYAAQLDTDWRP